MKLTSEHLRDLRRHAANRQFSQTGEDGILIHLFTCLGIEFGYLVDIGAGDGWSISNVRALLNAGWRGLLIDGKESGDTVCEMITDENVNDVMDKHNVPAEFDLLSLDIDGQDWWVWRALNRRPKIVVVEVNSCLKPTQSVTVPRYPPWVHDGTAYYGASFSAFVALGRAKGYTIVHNQEGLNLFFVRNDHMDPSAEISVPFVQLLVHPPDKQNRPWHAVVESDLIGLQGGP